MERKFRGAQFTRARKRMNENEDKNSLMFQKRKQRDLINSIKRNLKEYIIHTYNAEKVEYTMNSGLQLEIIVYTKVGQKVILIFDNNDVYFSFPQTIKYANINNTNEMRALNIANEMINDVSELFTWVKDIINEESKYEDILDKLTEL